MPRTKPLPTDSDRVRDLLMWARKQRIVVSEITVGAVHLVVSDLGMAGDRKPKTDEERKASLYETYGGKPMQDAAAMEEANSTYEDDGE